MNWPRLVSSQRIAVASYQAAARKNAAFSKNFRLCGSAQITLTYCLHGSEFATCKQNSVPTGGKKCLIFLRKNGAGEGIRTLDPNLGKVVLYP